MAEATKTNDVGGDDAKLLTGAFELSESRAAVQKQIEKAVDDLAGQVSFLIRPIVKSRLRAKNPARGRVQIELDGAAAAVVYDGERYQGVVGSTVDAKNGDEPIRLRFEREGRSLRVIFQAEDGEKRMVHDVSADGKKLSLEVTVTSSKLPAPLVYRVAYEKRG